LTPLDSYRKARTLNYVLALEVLGRIKAGDTADQVSRQIDAVLTEDQRLRDELRHLADGRVPA